MSAHLQLRLPIIKTIPTSQESDNTDTDTQTCITQEDCHTPKSPDHIIPPLLTCPPAPRKPRRTTSCKRKLSELDFFEVVGKEEVDSFFRRAEESIGVAVKRRCVV